ncbi:hypothetical protein KQI82_10185 [Oscillibacter sp. MSJ-2]|uniref:Uncharacterized protein n=1 Tax=Dysosmobacter acutus TaxID=2841504 RepID=A0ABS6FAF7_9FIRM|nr:DUF5685 family protein [Dysosmobacter acutus]MBU5627276.1 hypothetical protein [Dysosmobacter acutus]
MFGYVLPALGELPEEEKLRFRSVYCGLCHTLGRRYGILSRFILNYDFTFLAVLLSENQESPCQACRCLASPFKRRSVMESTPALELAADESVILTWWQLRDGVADHGFFKGLKYRLLSLLLRRAYRKAKKLRPEFDRSTREQLQILSNLERERCPSMDRAADAFAVLLSGAAQEVPEEGRRRVLREMLYHLGRWIYLIDAADDLKRDFQDGSYNPLIYRYGLTEGCLEADSRRDFSITLDHSIRLMASASALWDFGCWSAIIESTVTRSLFYVGGAVLDGSFRKKRKKETP